MRIFRKKGCKIVAAPGAPPPNPHWLPAAGDSAPDPRVVTLTYWFRFLESAFLALKLFCYFEK